ncbi:MAG: hypothetical protein ACKOA2_09845 [Ilumatobacteraceae bacterium]
MVAAAVDGSYVDPGNARLIIGAAIALVVLGIGLAVGTAWWWVRARPEHPALAGLEEMSVRRGRSSSAPPASVPVRSSAPSAPTASVTPSPPADPLLWGRGSD